MVSVGFTATVLVLPVVLRQTRLAPISTIGVLVLVIWGMTYLELKGQQSYVPFTKNLLCEANSLPLSSSAQRRSASLSPSML